MGKNNNNMGATWARKYNKWVVLVTIRGYTSNIGTYHAALLQKVLSLMLE